MKESYLTEPGGKKHTAWSQKYLEVANHWELRPQPFPISFLCFSPQVSVLLCCSQSSWHNLVPHGSQN